MPTRLRGSVVILPCPLRSHSGSRCSPMVDVIETVAVGDTAARRMKRGGAGPASTWAVSLHHRSCDAWRCSAGKGSMKSRPTLPVVVGSGVETGAWEASAVTVMTALSLLPFVGWSRERGMSPTMHSSSRRTTQLDLPSPVVDAKILIIWNLTAFNVAWQTWRY